LGREHDADRACDASIRESVGERRTLRARWLPPA